MCAAGSSPLARGLREAFPEFFVWERIIPARAGFTSVSVCDARAPADHPRSRGVYVTRSRRCRPASGSSPLARGLQGEAAESSKKGRIIPARAGFTVVGEGSVYDVKDHPRTRGVYVTLSVTSVDWRGSSPLARGLLIDPGFHGQITRIIPARAGFTECLQDHGQQG